MSNLPLNLDLGMGIVFKLSGKVDEKSIKTVLRASFGGNKKRARFEAFDEDDDDDKDEDDDFEMKSAIKSPKLKGATGSRPSAAMMITPEEEEKHNAARRGSITAKMSISPRESAGGILEDIMAYKNSIWTQAVGTL